MTVAEARRHGRSLLAGGESPELDVDLLLAAVLGQSQSWLRAHPEEALDGVQRQTFEELLRRRCRGEPVAYLLGRRAFWSLELNVSPATLVPRPDTETLVEYVLAQLPETPCMVADLGAGSGAIALALASERPQWQVLAVERSAPAMAVIVANLQALQLANVQVRAASWQELGQDDVFDAIVSNPPYIAASDPHLDQGDLRFEPRDALVAGHDGLDAIREIVALAPAHLHRDGLLVLEHGHDQAAAVAGLLLERGFEPLDPVRDLGGHLRVSAGRWRTP